MNPQIREPYANIGFHNVGEILEYSLIHTRICAKQQSHNEEVRREEMDASDHRVSLSLRNQLQKYSKLCFQHRSIEEALIDHPHSKI